MLGRALESTTRVVSAITRLGAGTGVGVGPVMPGVCPTAAPRLVVVPASQIDPLVMSDEVVKIGVCDQVRKVIFAFVFLSRRRLVSRAPPSGHTSPDIRYDF